MTSLFARAVARTGTEAAETPAAETGADGPPDADPDRVAAAVLRAAGLYAAGAPHRTPGLLQEMIGLAGRVDETVRDSVLELAGSAARAQNALAQLRAVQRGWAQSRIPVACMPPAAVAPTLALAIDPRGATATAEDLLIARQRMAALQFDSLPNAPVWPRVKLLLQAFGFDAALIAFLRGSASATLETAASLLAECEGASVLIFRTQLVQLFEFLTGTLGLVEPPQSKTLLFPSPEAPVPQLASTLDELG